MRKTVVRSLVVIGVATALFFIGLGIGMGRQQVLDAEAAKVSQKADTPPTRAELLKLVNAERKKVGVKPLEEDYRLDASAQMKAQSEIANHQSGHILNGKFVGQEFIDATGITCTLDAENLVANTQVKSWSESKPTPIPAGAKAYKNTAEDSIKSWMASKPHREILLNSKYTLTGFGIDGFEVVEHFCQP